MSELMQKNNSIQNISITYELLQDWINYIDVKPKSVETYTKAVRLFLEWLQNNNISQPTREDILVYREKLRLSLNPRTNKPLKATTIQSYIIAIRQFFNWLSQKGLYKNVAENIKGAKISKGFKKDCLTRDQTRNVLQNIKQDDLKSIRDYAMLSLMVTSGLRTVEVSRANIGDIQTVGNNNVLYIQGKGEDEKAEYIKLVPAVYKAIEKYLAMRYNNTEYQNTDALFTSTSNNNFGERMTTKSVSEIAKKSLQWVGLDSERLTAHSLRHTAITLSLIGGKTLQEVQQFARHSKIDTTLIYAQNLEREKNNCEEIIADAIFS